MIDLDAELAAMTELALEAAALVVRLRAESGDDRAGLGLELKGPDDPVTLADRQANALIVERLARAFPSHGVVAEESVQSDEEIARQSSRERVFFVDPIDGTREFSEGRADFAVMIGLAVAGRAVAGAVALPAEAVLLVGRVEGPLLRLDEHGHVTRPTVRGAARVAGSVAVVSRSHRSPHLSAILASLGGPTEVPTGSVGVKAARVATGAADLYLHPGAGAKKWDACAPEAIVRAAGGRFGDAFGDPLDYGGEDLVLRRGMCAANARLFAEATAATRAHLGGGAP